MRRLAAIVLTGAATSAAAQLPPVHLPQAPQIPQAPLQLPRTPDVTSVPGSAARSVQSVLDPANLVDLRRLAIRDRLREHRDVLESDPAGELIVRSEIVVF
jgi:hypothetical protein